MARRVRWRPGESVGPPVNSLRGPRPSASRDAISGGGSTRTRAAASSMARGSPSSRRQTATTSGATASVRAKSGLRRPGPLHEQAHRPGRQGRAGGAALRRRLRRQGQGQDRVDVLAAQAQGGPAGGQHAQAGRRPQQGGHQRSHPLQDVLAAIQQQQQPGAPEGRPQGVYQRLTTLVPHAHRARHGGVHQARVNQRGEGGEPHAVRSGAGCGARRLQGQAGLAHPPGAGQGQQAYARIAQPGPDGRHLLLPPHQAGEGRRQAGRPRGRRPRAPPGRRVDQGSTRGSIGQDPCPAAVDRAQCRGAADRPGAPAPGPRGRPRSRRPGSGRRRAPPPRPAGPQCGGASRRPGRPGAAFPPAPRRWWSAPHARTWSCPPPPGPAAPARS